MLASFVNVAGKTLLQMIFWVFILSLQWQGRTLFDRAHEVIVENALVDYLDGELTDLISRVGQATAARVSPPEFEDEEILD